jgi:hypothetical protein
MPMFFASARAFQENSALLNRGFEAFLLNDELEALQLSDTLTFDICTKNLFAGKER